MPSFSLKLKKLKLMELLILIASLALPQLSKAAANISDASNCTYVRSFSAEEGNMTCPDSAPVLSYLQTSASSADNHEEQSTTNWTMACSCPQWSLEEGETEIYWQPFSVHSGENSRSGHFECGLRHYLSGLTFEFNPFNSTYSWWGRCTEHPPGFISSSNVCWPASSRLREDRDGVVHTPHHTVIIRRVDVERLLGLSSWSFTFCLVTSVECTLPAIQNGYTDLSPTESDFITGLPTKVKFNEIVRIFCGKGYYLVGPNTSRCQSNEEWSQLPVCEACRPIYRCRVVECSDGRTSFCTKCKDYTASGLRVVPNRSRKKCRVIPYIRRTESTFQLFVYQPGSSLRLDCPAEGNPKPIISWRSYTHDNASVTQLVEPELLCTFTNGSLLMKNISSSDEGVYFCMATNSVGSDWMYVVLINYYSYRFEHVGQAIVILNQTELPFFFPENEAAFLHCRTSGTPPPRIRWSKRDSDVQYYLPAYGDLRVHIHSNGTLAFYPIRRDDSGVYACEAINDYGGDVATSIVCVGDFCGGDTHTGGIMPPLEDLIVYRPFIIKWTHVHFIQEGESLSLTCVAGGNPKPFITWRLRDSMIIYNSRLSLTNLTLDDTGIYECFAHNFKGEDRRKVAIIVSSRISVTPTALTTTATTTDTSTTNMLSSATIAGASNITLILDSSSSSDCKTSVIKINFLLSLSFVFVSFLLK